MLKEKFLLFGQSHFQRLLRGGALVFIPFLRLIEFFLFRKVKEKDDLSPIFIIGAPRSGSTILYQMLTKSLKCSYVNNLICMFSYNIKFGFWLSNFIFKDKKHNSFVSTYGNTNNLDAPSECGKFWYRWFSREKDYIIEENFGAKNVETLRRTINDVMSITEKPLVFKNLQNGQRLDVLKKAFPNAKYVYIKRSPLFIIQSVLLARKDLNFSEDYWWSVKPKEFQDLKKKDYLQKIVGQIFYSLRQIEEDLSLINKENWITIDYEKINADKFADLQRFLDIEIKEELDFEEFNFSNRIKLQPSEIKTIKESLKIYDWGSINYEAI